MGKRIKRLERIEIVHPNAAGLDIGAREIFGCVPPDREGETVQAFGTFTPDLHHLADWLVANHIDTVAMESTGVYWIPVMEILEARGLSVYLVNARHIKNEAAHSAEIRAFVVSKHSIRILEESAESYYNATESLLNRLGYSAS